jgi:hypothetical protein
MLLMPPLLLLLLLPPLLLLPLLPCCRCCRAAAAATLPLLLLLLPLMLQDLVKNPSAAPFRSPSAVLQEHVNPEHAAHFAAVNAGKDVDMDLSLDPSLPKVQK